MTLHCGKRSARTTECPHATPFPSLRGCSRSQSTGHTEAAVHYRQCGLARNPRVRKALPTHGLPHSEDPGCRACSLRSQGSAGWRPARHSRGPCFVEASHCKENRCLSPQNGTEVLPSPTCWLGTHICQGFPGGGTSVLKPGGRSSPLLSQ